MGLIAIDLDGTLINNEHKISQENIKAIKKAQELDYEVVIATGRAHFDVQQILEAVNLPLYTIGANGATVHSPSETVILTVPMKDEHVKKSIAWLEQENFYYEVFCEKGIYTPKNSQDILYQELEDSEKRVTDSEYAYMQQQLEKQLGQSGFVYMEDSKEVFEDNNEIYNILAYSLNTKKLQKGRDQFKRETEFTFVTSSTYNFELEHRNASKGNAVAHLAKVLDVNMEKTMAIGDSGNDVSMFKVVSDSFAMANASDDVKAEAKYITVSNDENGVAQAIYQFIETHKI